LHAVPDHSAFVAALEAELAAYDELRQLLQAEQDSLESGDVDSLQHITALKASQVERLAALGATRAAYLTSVQLSADPHGMEAWLRDRAGTQRQRLTQTWQRLLQVAAQARTLNDLNGGLMATRMHHNQAALAALQGAGRQQMVYGPDGQNDFRPANRDLGRA
jgi:flagella synthesis protein FlgN